MKTNHFFKHNSDFQHKISSRYDREVTIYQFEYNRKHPQKHIWRHLLYKRTFYFYLDGKYLAIEVEIVRFRHAKTNHTFTFYGTLFCAYSHFSVGFIQQAVSSAEELLSPSALAVSIKTLNGWKNGWERNGFSSQSTQNHKPGYWYP